jgi:hypothetical protein
MANKVADAGSEKLLREGGVDWTETNLSQMQKTERLLTDMYANPDDYVERHDEESIHTYRQAVNDIAFLTFPPYIWMKITGQ